MILGSSKADDTQRQIELNTREFYDVFYSRLLFHHPVVRLSYLVQRGIKVNYQDSSGCTPVYLGVMLKSVELVQQLIGLGADANIRCNEKKLNFPTPLHRAVASDNPEIVTLLINAGAIIDAQDEQSKTPLHIATASNKTKMVELLLSLGANTELKDNEGRTALHIATIYRFINIVGLLLNSKAEIDAIDNEGNTPLHLAQWEYTKIAQLLLDNGADSSILNRSGETPLKIAFKVEFEMYYIDAEYNYFRKSLLLYINKFFKAEYWRFEDLREKLGEGFDEVATAEDMVARILAKPKHRIEAIVGIIDQLYPNAAKMAPPSLVSRLFAVLKEIPAQECAASAVPSQDCIEDEQPPVMMIPSARKRNQQDSDIEKAADEQSTKRSRTRCWPFCR